MNTTAAALEARVTVATVRTWCRLGAVAAVKQAGRWVIDAASLAHRIALGALKRPARKTAAVVYSVETMTAIGGRRWQRGDKDRVYLNDWAAFAGLETSHYNTGNISSASWQGEHISNSQAYKLAGCIDKVWFDTADGKLHGRYGFSESRVASREEVWAAVVSGIRAAIAAL
ncbi:hypothetical protein [Streptomyces sp. Ac-502]|uniref:hypothetical protein n=1 Tax=Streptomyces sp. Ac-502 TaxID=3342801 RepID=UPI0038623D62